MMQIARLLTLISKFAASAILLFITILQKENALSSTLSAKHIPKRMSA